MEETKYAIISSSEDSNMLILKQLESETLMSVSQWQNVQITTSLLLFDCCYCNSFLSLISYSTDVSENKLLMYLTCSGWQSSIVKQSVWKSMFSIPVVIYYLFPSHHPITGNKYIKLPSLMCSLPVPKVNTVKIISRWMMKY